MTASTETKLKALIVDDNPEEARLTAQLLRNWASCVLALTGEDAIEQFEVGLRQAKPYRLIFLDIHMPGMDGKEVLSKIRSIEAERKLAKPQCAKIVMLTASADQQDVMETILEGCDGYIVKPPTPYIIETELIKLRIIKA